MENGESIGFPYQPKACGPGAVIGRETLKGRSCLVSAADRFPWPWCVLAVVSGGGAERVKVGAGLFNSEAVQCLCCSPKICPYEH